MAEFLPAFSGLRSTGQIGNYYANKNRQASAREIQRREHEKGVYSDNVDALMSAAMSNGFSKNGYELDEAAIDAAVARKRAGEATPRFDAFAAQVANTQFADQLAEHFQFDSLVQTPEGDMTLEGSYQDGPNKGTRAPMTEGATAEGNDPVALVPQESVGGLLSTAYATVMNDPMYANKSAEMQRLIMLGRETQSARAKAGAFTARVTRELTKVTGPKQARALMMNLADLSPDEQVVYMRDNILPAMQMTLDDFNMSQQEQQAIEQTQPDDSAQPVQTQAESEAEAPVDPQTATEIEKLNNELQSLPTGSGGEARRRAIKAKIKSLGASSEAKEFADSEEGSAPPEQVSEEQETGIIAWAKENPVDAAMLAASGLLLLAGPAGWAARGLLTTARATPAAARWIAGQTAKKGPAAARGAVSKPKYKGKPRNAQGQLTTKGNEARQFSAGRAGATGLVLTGASVGIQEVVSENPELESESDATKSAVTKGVNSANDNLQNGEGPSFTQQELNDFAAFLNKKGITNVEGAVDESTDIKQTLLAVLSVTISDPTRRAEAQKKFMNIMETGDQGFSAKDLSTLRTERANLDLRQDEFELAVDKHEASVDTETRAADKVVLDYDKETDKRVRSFLVDEDGNKLDPEFDEIQAEFFGGSGIVTNLLKRMRAQKESYERRPREQSMRQYTQYKDRVMTHISLAMQLASADDGLEVSFATESGSISGSDRFLSRIATNTDGGFDILKPGTNDKDGDGFTRNQALQLIGDVELYDLFVKEVKKSMEKRGIGPKRGK